MNAHGLTDAVCCFMRQTSNYSITVRPHFCVHFAVLEEEKPFNSASVYERHCHESIRLPGVAVGRKMCFLSCTLFVCLSPRKKMYLQHINESITGQFFRGQKNLHAHFIFFVFLCHSLSHTDVRAHTHTCKTHTYTNTNVHIQTHTKKAATLFLSVLMSLGTMKSLP